MLLLAPTQATAMSKPLDATLSTEIAKRIKSKAKNSFDNAYNAVLVTEGATYVQGFLVFAGDPYKPIEHSWIELENCLVDPTLPHLNKNAEEVYYFPAHRLSVEELKAAVEEAKEDYPEDPPLPIYGAAPYEYYGDIMLGGAEYQAAYKEALAKSKELNKPKLN
jgi:hypothetical protein